MIDSKYKTFIKAISQLKGNIKRGRLPKVEKQWGLGVQELIRILDADVKCDPGISPEKVEDLNLQLKGAKAVATGDAFSEISCEKKEKVYPSVSDIAHRVKQGLVSPVDVANNFLNNVKQQQHLNAFISIRPDKIYADARLIQRKLDSGEDPGPLAGVPVGIKDLMSVEGYRLTAGTKAKDYGIQQEDAPVVRRLRAAGALIVGTTNLHELAFGVTSRNPHFGHVQNPIAPGYIPGGSSGGSAAAVASGLIAMGVGSCTGGSIRQPAACCGVVGFKGTWGAVPTDGVVPLAWSLDHIGPITRSVSDAALTFEVMAGLGISKRSNVESPPSFIIPRRYFYEHIDPRVRNTVQNTIDKLQGFGANVSNRDILGIDYSPGIQAVTIASEASQANEEILKNNPDALGDDVRLRLEAGHLYLATEYLKAQRLRRQVRTAAMNIMGAESVFLVPAMPVLPPKINSSTVMIDGKEMHVGSLLMRFTSPFNFCGFPALSMPCGVAENGLPVNIQIVGQPGSDLHVLQVAKWCEERLSL